MPPNVPLAPGTPTGQSGTDTPNPSPTGAAPVNSRVDAFKRNLPFMWRESLALTGLPIDSLLGQLFASAAASGLSAQGEMLNWGSGPRFVPNHETIATWLDAYFAQAFADNNNMPEA